MSEEDTQSGSKSWMAILMGIGICAIFAALLLRWLEPPKPTKCKGNPPTNICKNRLHALSLMISNYYSSGKIMTLPIIHDPHITADVGGFGFDANMLTCPAEHLGHLYYVWNPKLSGGKWADWNHPNSPLIWDASPHRVNGKINVLFGDGHVEEMTPERLRELTK